MDIRERILPQDEADRLYEKYPTLGESWVDYCPTCKKKGTYLWQGVERTCDCEEQLQLHKHYLNSGITTELQRLTWDDLGGVKGAIIDQVVAYMDYADGYLDRGMGLLHIGTRGTGKTMLAVLVLKEMVKRGYDCWYSTFVHAIDMHTAGLGAGSEARKEKRWFARKIINSQILLLDDLGQEGQSEAKRQLAESVINMILRERVQGGRTTFVTSNLTPTQIGERYGGAVLDLLIEKSILLEFAGDTSFRSDVAERTRREILAGETRPIV